MAGVGHPLAAARSGDEEQVADAVAAGGQQHLLAVIDEQGPLPGEPEQLFESPPKGGSSLARPSSSAQTMRSNQAPMEVFSSLIAREQGWALVTR